MSTPNGPIRRRRIAGEPKPAAEPAETRRKLIPKAARKPAAKPVVPTKPPVSKPPVSKDRPSPAKAAPAGEAKASQDVPRVKLDVWDAVKQLLAIYALWIFLLVAIAALVFGAVFAVKGVSDFREQRGIEASNASASAAAGKAAELIFSFRYDKLDQHLTESKALMTPTFKKEFDKIAPALTELAPQRKIEVQAKSRNAAALECGNECSPTKSSILVFLDQARLVGDSKVPTVFGNRIVVSMVKTDGVWLVNDIKAL